MRAACGLGHLDDLSTWPMIDPHAIAAETARRGVPGLPTTAASARPSASSGAARACGRGRLTWAGQRALRGPDRAGPGSMRSSRDFPVTTTTSPRCHPNPETHGGSAGERLPAKARIETYVACRTPRGFRELPTRRSIARSGAMGAWRSRPSRDRDRCRYRPLAPPTRRWRAPFHDLNARRALRGG